MHKTLHAKNKYQHYDKRCEMFHNCQLRSHTPILQCYLDFMNNTLLDHHQCICWGRLSWLYQLIFSNMNKKKSAEEQFLNAIWKGNYVAAEYILPLVRDLNFTDSRAMTAVMMCATRGGLLILQSSGVKNPQLCQFKTDRNLVRQIRSTEWLWCPKYSPTVV